MILRSPLPLATFPGGEGDPVEMSRYIDTES
jgi:hypothetical protein